MGDLPTRDVLAWAGILQRVGDSVLAIESVRLAFARRSYSAEPTWRCAICLACNA